MSRRRDDRLRTEGCESRSVRLVFVLLFSNSNWAYHLLVCIERAFLEQGIHTSWETLRRQLSTHQVVTVRNPIGDGRLLCIRRDNRPEPIHCDIYRALRIPERIVSPIKRWTQNSH
jgi:hypothetical protein